MWVATWLRRSKPKGHHDAVRFIDTLDVAVYYAVAKDILVITDLLQERVMMLYDLIKHSENVDFWGQNYRIIDS